MKVKNSLWNRTLNAINSLHDPYIVSSFQNFFGVYRTETYKNGETVTESPTSTSRVKNLQNGVQKRNKVGKCHKCPSVSPIHDDNHLEYEIKSNLWYYIFSFGTSLGYELFYASFFPLWVWNLNSAVCRRVVNLWVFIMYIGQALKDIICWPRPSSPPVVHLEPNYVSEYGMPSTHAMVSVALPFSFWYFTNQRYDYPFAIGLLTCVIWCILVCCSRLYMGMHTMLDIIAGLSLAPFLMLLILPFSDAIDKFQQTNFYSPFITTIVMIFFQVTYPRTGGWSPARGDTSVIMGTGTGFAFGSWLNYHLGLNRTPTVPFPLPLLLPSYQEIGLGLLRMIIGLICLVIIRNVVKTVMYATLCFAMSLDAKNPLSRRKVTVEIPTKYVTYIGVGLLITFIAPEVFRFLHIERDSMYLEV